MTKTQTSTEICFCFKGELLCKIPDFILKKFIETNKQDDCNKYGLLFNDPERLLAGNKREINNVISNLQSDVSWDKIAPFITGARDSCLQIEKIWKQGKNTLGDYSIELKHKIIPDKIFRYMPYQKERLEKLFIENLLYLPSPQKFNDPFDCGTDKEVFKIYKDKAMGCFSIRYDNILMFSHYAGSHKGICVGFSTDLLLDSLIKCNNVNASLRPVWYFNTVPSFDLKKEPVLCVTGKYDIWSYEEEYRLFLNKENTLYPEGEYSFNNESIISIYFGCNASDEIIKIVKDMLIHLPDSGFFRAYIVPNKYEITFKPV